MSRILVIGCASVDTVHLPAAGRTATHAGGGDSAVPAGDNCTTTHIAAGGAGLYTALAARKAGADVVLWAPRTDPLPELFQSVERLVTWTGPRCQPETMPMLEIVHHGDGRATLLGADWGAEEELVPEKLDEDCSAFDVVHIAALSSAAKQRSFLARARKLGAKVISVGTYARAIEAGQKDVQQLLDASDIFFMNKNEARLLFGDDCFGGGSLERALDCIGRELILYVTDGRHGSALCHGGRISRIAAVEAIEVDPTGAGDTFCGGTLARLAFGIAGGESHSAKAEELDSKAESDTKLKLGANAKTAAQIGAALAAKTISKPGPQALIECGM